MANFNDIYEKIYVEYQDKLERLRKIAKRETIIRIIVLIIGLGSLISLGINPTIIAIILAIVSLIATLFLLSNRRLQYNKIFKEKIITEIVKSHGENLNYAPKAGISRYMYNEGEFERYDRYTAEDGIVGTTNQGYKINMSEVHTEEKYEDEDGHTHYRTIFRGAFTKVEMDKYVPCKIKIRKNTLKIFDNNRRIEMDSGEFEKYYDIYSENKIIAMQLFTADMLQTFVDVKDMKPEVTIKSNNIYIRFEIGNMFEANIFKDSLDYLTLKKYYDIIGFTIRLSETLTKNINETEI